MGDHPDAKPVFDLDSVQLLELINKMNNGLNYNNLKWRRPSHRLVQCGYLIVESLATLVETSNLPTDNFGQILIANRTILGKIAGDFEQIQRSPCIAVRRLSQQIELLISQLQAQLAQATLLVRECPLQELLDLSRTQGFEHIHPGARQQGIIQFKRRVFGGGTNEDQGAIFHVWQESILLRLVETMYFVDEKYRCLTTDRMLLPGPINSGTDVFHPGQDS